MAQTFNPPLAKRIPYLVRSPNGDRVDEYYWMRDDDASSLRQDILEHLEAENAYTTAMLARLRPLQDKLIAEIRSRIAEDDATAPYYDRGYWYWWRFDADAEYPVFLRRRGTPAKPDPAAMSETLLDLPRVAAGKPYFSVGALAVSPNGRWLAWTEDSVGRRSHTLHFMNLATGELSPDRIHGVLESIVWANDDKTLFYVRQDPQTLHSGAVCRHTLGTDPATDSLVYEEENRTKFTSLYRSASGKYVLINVSDFDTTESLAVTADSAANAADVVLPCRPGVRSYADHLNGRWVIRTNEHAPNFRLVEAPEEAPADCARWKDLAPARADVTIEGFALFERTIAIEERADGISRISVVSTDGNPSFVVVSVEPGATMHLGENLDPASTSVRYTCTSMVTPVSTFDVDLETGQRLLLRRQPVLGFDRSLYVTERLWAPSRDGNRIPVSLAYRSDRFKRDGSSPLYAEGYGAYGYSIDVAFSANRVSLLDRGFVVAVAHARGGGELGQRWYDDGRLLNKRNTFNDFVDVTDFLVREGYGSEDKVFASGISAGGLLMGAVANEAGSKYRGIAMHCPFVDVVTTMLDTTIPLTTIELSQWGDPHQKKYYDYMLSYSPYDNIAEQDYPSMLITAALWDSRVHYYEPAKYVARLRARKTDVNPLLFYLNQDAGHGGGSGRLEHLSEVAREYAFFLDLAGIQE